MRINPTLSYPISISGTRLQASGLIYTRYHGVPKLYYSTYSQEELTHLGEQIQLASAEIVYTYFNNTTDLEAIGNARWLQHYLIKT